MPRPDPSEGWTKLVLPVPDSFLLAWKGATPNPGDARLLGTAAIGLICSLPPRVRLELMRTVHNGIWPGPPTVLPEDILAKFAAVTKPPA